MAYIEDLVSRFVKIEDAVEYDHWGTCSVCGASGPTLNLKFPFEATEEIEIRTGKIGHQTKTICSVEKKELSFCANCSMAIHDIVNAKSDEHGDHDTSAEIEQ